jgi:hypothetical protein
MTTRLASLILVLLGALALGADRARSDDPPSPEDMRKLMIKYATPGEQHKQLARLLGTWDVEFRMSPDAPPVKGTAETTWWIEGRFIQTRIKVPEAWMGMNFESVDVLGWDNYKHKWVGTATNSMSTALMSYEGVVVDPTGKVRVLYGPLDEYLTGEHDKPVKYVTRNVSDDKHVLEVHDLAIGENGAVVLHFTFVRRKG